MKKYTIQFDLSGLLVFLMVMIPNFIWFAVPAPNDVLRNESVTPTLDLIASIFQVIMVGLLCLVRNKSVSHIRFPSVKMVLCSLSVLLYFTAWIAYSTGIVTAAVLLALCIFPCAAFFFFEAEKKNYLAMIPTAGFTVLHLLYGIVNFVV